MSDINKSNDDQFRSAMDDPNRDTNDKNQEQQPSQTAYYSYGPFRSAAEHFPGNNADETARISAEDVEITVPEPIKQMPVEASTASEVRRNKPERSSWKAMFASFMAGVVVVGGLMFAADKANLFTPDSAVNHAETSGSVIQTNQSGTSGGHVQHATVDVVRPNNIAEIVANSSAAVVKIETYSKASTNRRTNPFYNDPFFRFFFGDDQDSQSSRSDQLVKTGEGSGFIFDSEGYILTNQHVVDGADEIRVYLEGHKDYYKAEMLGDSYELDLAAIKITGGSFPSLKLGNVDELKVGDWVIAIGNPYGFDHTVTVGVLSAKERPITIRDGQRTRQYEHLLQTDASINPGNSGGPLLNLNGEVIGINTAVSAQAQGIGFAIPTSTISDVLDNLKHDKPIPKAPAPYIGVYPADLDEAWAKELDYNGKEGSVVTQVEVGGPASRAGLQPYDIITEVDGTKIKNAQELRDKISEYDVGAKISIKIFRQGKTYEAIVTVGDRNAG